MKSIKSEQDHGKLISRRAIIMGTMQTAALGVLGGRLAWLQVAQGSKYRTLSDKNRINVKMLAPSRGTIVDRYGVPLAVNGRNFRVLIVPEQVKDIESVLRALQSHIDLQESDIRSVLKEAKRNAKFVPIEVKDDLSWDEVAKIEVNLPDLPGLSTDVGQRRTYPFADATAHVVGYVGAVNEREIDQDPLLSLPGFRIGKTGIEKKFDKELRGEKGTAQVEVNVVGREVRELDVRDSHSGERLILTLDGELQRFTQTRLAQERSASAVIMDAHTGAVYTLASSPAFDPNLFISGMPFDIWEQLRTDAAHPLVNKAIAGQYPPASTFKMVVALAGLRAGLVNSNRTSFCGGHFQYGKDKFHCWKKHGHGRVDVMQAIQHSCDVFFYELAVELGIEKIAREARLFGLGDKLGFELTEESPGLVPDKEWKLGYNGRKWQVGETIVTSIGQGSLLATPLQMAVMTARMVNGGYAVKPWITSNGLAPNSKMVGKWPKMDVKQSHIEMVLKGMEDVVNDRGGTAYASRIVDEELAFAGKTGTGQVQRITMAQRKAGVKNEDLDWKQRHHALFVGYAPYKNPRYVCSVVVEHGVGGSKAAAPIAKEILLEAQRRAPHKAMVGEES
ncbi:MAG: penicillin-binding protein 2 [Micavibrio sp. TMED27]|nr:penicillin-binding protein 2 [Micavibrio sp.]OUT90738.1 MAG: penicillin-binding protein 2 [Micavibrio sp. TMED27]|tara:strand:- start:2152 stop:4005 length:1854 start_codon:yes stop_codon:yes gene_type:complete